MATRRFRTCVARPRSRSSTASRRSNSFRSGASTVPRRMQAEGHSLGLRAEAGRCLSGRCAQEWRSGDVRSHDAGWRHPALDRTSAPPSWTTQAPGSVSSRNTSSTRTAVRSASRKPAIRPAGPLLHRRRLQECRLGRPRDRRRASRALPRGRHQPRRHQCRSGEGPVGIPDFRQGLQDAPPTKCGSPAT